MQFLALPWCTIQVNFLWPHLAEYVALPHIGAINTADPEAGAMVRGLFRARKGC